MMNHEDVAIDINAMLEKAQAPVSDECCIYRVPLETRKLNKDEYTPKVISIGPFHHGHPRFRSMEQLKLMYCKAFLERTETSSDTWVRHIEQVEPKVRCCYLDAPELCKKEWVKIILVDSGFILELFWRSYNNRWSHADVCLLKPWLMNSIGIDLLLLENQLPFFVLQDLFNLSFGGNNFTPSFLQLTFDYFNNFNKSQLNFDSNINILHFTDLIRTFHLQHPCENRSHRTNKLLEHIPSVTELSEAGLRFKGNTENNCLLDLKFSRGTLEIPQLIVGDLTEVIYRNMIALEQCHYPYESYITDYVHVLDFLINTNKDVDILVRKGVLINYLGDSDSVANLFNGLLKNICFSNFSSHYFDLRHNLNAFYSNPWRNLRSTLRRGYCKDPWQTAATIAAIILLMLSLLQSVCSILQVIQG